MVIKRHSLSSILSLPKGSCWSSSRKVISQFHNSACPQHEAPHTYCRAQATPFGNCMLSLHKTYHWGSQCTTGHSGRARTQIKRNWSQMYARIKSSCNYYFILFYSPKWRGQNPFSAAFLLPNFCPDARKSRKKTPNMTKQVLICRVWFHSNE